MSVAGHLLNNYVVGDVKHIRGLVIYKCININILFFKT